MEKFQMEILQIRRLRTQRLLDRKRQSRALRRSWWFLQMKRRHHFFSSADFLVITVLHQECVKLRCIFYHACILEFSFGSGIDRAGYNER